MEIFFNKAVLRGALRGGKTKFVDFLSHRGIHNKKLGKVKNF